MRKDYSISNSAIFSAIAATYRGLSSPLMAIVCLFAGFTRPSLAAPPETAELAAIIAKIDRTLVQQNETDIREWLDARIAETGRYGVYSFGYTSVQIKENVAHVDLNRGSHADAAAQFFRAYEMLGDRKYLDAGLKTADFFLQIQQPAGHFPTGAIVQPDGKASAGGGKCPLPMARMEDGYQFRPFTLLMTAYKLTGDKKYFEAAKRVGDLVVERLQHPEWGWCATEFDTRIEGATDKQLQSNGAYGVRGG